MKETDKACLQANILALVSHSLLSSKSCPREICIFPPYLFLHLFFDLFDIEELRYFLLFTSILILLEIVVFLIFFILPFFLFGHCLLIFVAFLEHARVKRVVIFLHFFNGEYFFISLIGQSRSLIIIIKMAMRR